MTILILVRHGENDWVKKNRLAGWIPGVHLNENGHRQAAEMAGRLAPLKIQALYSSPVARCVETAKYIAEAQGVEPILLDDLGEVRYGKWEGKRVKKLAKKRRWHAVQFFPSRVRFPEGEALREVQFRAIQTLERLCAEKPEEVIAVVSHADVLKAVLAYYLGIHIDLFQRLVVGPASVSILHLAKNGYVRVLRLNDEGPLQPFERPTRDDNKEN